VWQRFTESARKVIFYAQEEAQNAGGGNVSTEHILLGLLREENVAAKVLAKLGIDLDQFKESVRNEAGRTEKPPAQDMTLTPRAKRVIDLAYDEARRLQNNYIGTEHLLLGLIKEGDGLAGRILKRANVDLEIARETVRVLQGSEIPANESNPEYRAHPSRSVFPSMSVSFQFQTLHPVDQWLLALISDSRSQLGLELRTRCANLDFRIAAIVGVMAASAQDPRPTLDSVLANAQEIAVQQGRQAAMHQDFFVACLTATSDPVKDAFLSLDLNPLT
jgi:ATP-dependent Clp protease ATP-binding subunit ClpA